MKISQRAMVEIFHANGIRGGACLACAKSYGVAGMNLSPEASYTYGKHDIHGRCPKCFKKLVVVKNVSDGEVRYADEKAQNRTV